MEPPPAKKARVPKVAKVKNKMPAEVQITAEQLLQEANATKIEKVAPRPKQRVTDPDELAQLQLRKRKEFEDNIRKNRNQMANWMKYGMWEESQGEFERARSVFERGIDVDHRCVTIWLKYAEMEMKNKQVNHARNIWDRAVTILPRTNQFWYKYSYMEEMMGNVAGARRVFERWMEWEPEEQAWLSYIKMELRYKELDNARNIYERFIVIHPDTRNWIRYARFEESRGSIANARSIFERAIEFFGEDLVDERLMMGFARFEEGCQEYERARTIYKFALDRLPKSQVEELFKAYTHFEKKYGDRSGIEDVIINKRKFQYEEKIKQNPTNYDTWFDYIRLMEADGSVDATRDIYERAIANVPPIQEKGYWRRYIYLWIYYALYEELMTKDMERTREVYQACLKIIPHTTFTFSKIWLMYAQFEIRQKDLKSARKALGTALGKCPTPKLYKGYIELELQLREFDRCRKLYEKFLEFNHSNCTTWIKYTELETILGDTERARAIFELAIDQPLIDMPEILWKAYIDFEIEEEEPERVRNLYERLLERTQHMKVFLSYAKYEQSIETDNNERVREIFARGNKHLKDGGGSREERVMLLEAWRDFERASGDMASLEEIQKKLPRRVKKKRKMYRDDGSDGGWEEYWDYVFPEDQTVESGLKLLQMARQWKQQGEESESSSEEEGSSEEEEEGSREEEGLDNDRDVGGSDSASD